MKGDREEAGEKKSRRNQTLTEAFFFFLIVDLFLTFLIVVKYITKFTI